jgi:uncharacterized damage-inducible protein DinB
MDGRLLRDAFGHHVWATITLIDVCAGLTPEQLASAVPGTYGSVIDTLRHLVAADASYLWTISGGQVERLDDEAEAAADLATLRAAMVVARHRDDGSSFSAPLGIRLAQVVHHGTDHRSQVCTALTGLGVTPPEIDVWDYAATQGRTFETPAT